MMKLFGTIGLNRYLCPIMSRQKEFDYDEKLMEARELFWRKGYNATSLNDLVDALKINRSSLYLTYGNKHDLFIKCLKSYNALRGKEYNKAAKSSENPLQAIENMIMSVLDTIKESKTCLVVNSSFELARVDSEVKNMLKSQMSWGIRVMEELMVTAQKNGQIPAEKDVKALAHFTLMSLTAIWHTDLLYSDEKLVRQMAKMLIDNVSN
ncbi:MULTISPECIES: TetR/AcrR family transcriptional regulator [Flavobacterium]|uniref:TetR/AcrR family transcriptional regulator n=1 Tax=Flavobacterium TaxID=237 RepID=UPI0021140232|nr:MULTISPECIES: TetR/AcrR family transcriptional regulator [Flavobacterium]UUF13106.1 TetR/AcrR family transcriptional regulator [Flavobacterium panici]